MRRVWTTKRNRSLSKAKNHHSDFGRHVISSIGAAALGIATTMPAFAGGSNTATTAATPATPAGVVTSTPQLSSVGAGGCAWQYTKAINNLGQQAITANDVGLAANAVGAAADVGGDALQVNFVYLNLVVKQLQHTDVYLQFFAGNQGIFVLVFKINVFQHNQLGKTEADMSDFYRSVNFTLYEGNGFIFYKILNGWNLY